MAFFKYRPRLHRRIRGKRVLCVFLVIILTICALSMAATTVFFRFCFPGRADDTAFLSMTYEDIDAQAYPRSVITFYAGSRHLQGYLYGEGNTNGVVLIVRGIKSTADRHLTEMMYFIDRNWVVFSFDEGEYQNSSANEMLESIGDLQAALSYLASSVYAELPVVLYGHSMGAYAAAGGMNDSVRAVACLAGFNAPTQIMHHYAKQKVGLLADLEYPILLVYDYLAFGTQADRTAVDGINEAGVPVLIVDASNDDVVPRELSITACQEQIENPYVSYLTIDGDNRNGHSTLWLSAQAGAYHAQVFAQVDTLRAQNGGSLPQAEQERLAFSIDKLRLNEVDTEFMDRINAFFLNTVK